MKTSFHLCALIVAMVALTMCIIVDTAPPTKGETPSKRPTRGQAAGANGPPLAADELLAASLQAEEEAAKKTNNSCGGPSDGLLAKLQQEEENKAATQVAAGGPSDATLARQLQEAEDASASGKKRKVPCLKSKAAASKSSEATAEAMVRTYIPARSTLMPAEIEQIISIHIKNVTFTLFSQDHLSINQEGARINVWGPGTQFPNIQGVLPRLKFFKSESSESKRRPFLVTTDAASLFEMMRSMSSFNPGSAWQTMNLDNAKKFIVSQAEESNGGEDGAAAASTPHRTSLGGGKTSFSPKKPKALDTRPAILARKSWTITVNRDNGTVTISGKLSFLIGPIFFSTIHTEKPRMHVTFRRQVCTTFTGAWFNLRWARRRVARRRASSLRRKRKSGSPTSMTLWRIPTGRRQTTSTWSLSRTCFSWPSKTELNRTRTVTAAEEAEDAVAMDGISLTKPSCPLPARGDDAAAKPMRQSP
jgi:hypothetical protein